MSKFEKKSGKKGKKEVEARSGGVAVGIRELAQALRNVGSSTDSVDVKTTIPPALAPSMEPRALLAAARSTPLKEGVTLKDVMRSMGLTTKPITVMLWLTSAQSSAANTAMTFTQRLRPSDSAEFTSFAALYDEYKAIGATIMYHFAISGAPTTNVDFAACYDPVNSAVVSSVAEVLPARHHTYCNLSYSTVNAGAGWPLYTSKDGHSKHTFPFPAGTSIAVSGGSTVATGTWQDTATTAADYGYWKGYGQAAGAGNVLSVGYHVGMKVQFRMRS